MRQDPDLKKTDVALRFSITTTNPDLELAAKTALKELIYRFGDDNVRLYSVGTRPANRPELQYADWDMAVVRRINDEQ